MFGSNATRLARIDWSKYGLMELAGTAEPTNEQLKRAVMGLSVGIKQLAEELANCMGNVDIPLQHRAPFISLNYNPDAPGVDPDDEELESFFPQVGTVSGDSWNDPSDGRIYGGQAGFARGVWIFQPAINNPNVAANNGQQRIVLKGGLGAGLCFENIYVDNLYDRSGNPFSTANLPAGSVMLWAGSVGSIPSGWALMDGTANSAGNGGSGIDMRGLIPYGYSGSGDFATIGASVAIALSWTGDPISGGSAVNTGNAGSHAHTVATSEITSKVGVNDHASHTHEVTFTGSQVAATLANHTSGGTSGGGAGTDDVAYGTISAHATSGTSMTSDSAVPSPTLTHTVTCSSSLDTNTVSDHTHTVATTAIAAQLTIGTPTSVRTPGAVLAFIEKLSV